MRSRDATLEEICVLATGEIVCSCGDPAGLAVYGNVHRDRVEEVFRGRRSNFRVDRAYRSGRTATLPLAPMLRVVEQLPELEKLLFYDFGEPFLHPDAIAFLRELRRRRPDVTVHASTNGLALTPEATSALAGEALADRVVFSIDGTSEASYRRYRRGGSFTRARAALAALAEECGRAPAGESTWSGSTSSSSGTTATGSSNGRGSSRPRQGPASRSS